MEDKVIDARTSGGKSNILELYDPDNFLCSVRELGSASAQLRIDLKDLGNEQTDTQFLFLENILYFDGPLTWVGANMRVGTDADLAHLIQKISTANRSDAPETSSLAQGLALYILKSGDLHIRLIADTTLVLSSTPRLYEA